MAAISMASCHDDETITVYPPCSKAACTALQISASTAHTSTLRASKTAGSQDSLGRQRWKRKGESAALAQRAFNPNSSTMLLHNAASDRQAQTRAALFPSVRGIDLLKAFENAFAAFPVECPAPGLSLETESDLLGVLHSAKWSRPELRT